MENATVVSAIGPVSSEAFSLIVNFVAMFKADSVASSERRVVAAVRLENPLKRFRGWEAQVDWLFVMLHNVWMGLLERPIPKKQTITEMPNARSTQSDSNQENRSSDMRT
jgi:hypothetical protein